MAVGRHWSPRSTEAMFLHMSAAVFSVPRVHHTLCSGHADCLAVPHLMWWSCLVCQSFRSSEEANGPREDVWLHFNSRQPGGSTKGLASPLLVADSTTILP